MPITFACPGCTASLTVADAAAGRAGKCPHCKGSIQVPAAAESIPVLQAVTASNTSARPAMPLPAAAAPPPVHAQVLAHIIKQYGRAVCDDPRRLKALLADFLGKYPGSHDQPINLLVLALENRVVQDLLVSNALPTDMVQKRIADRLQTSLGLTPQAARWTVAAWAEALGQRQTPGVAAVAAGATMGGGDLKPITQPVAEAIHATEGPQALDRFGSVTQPAAAWPRAAAAKPKAAAALAAAGRGAAAAARGAAALPRLFAAVVAALPQKWQQPRRLAMLGGGGGMLLVLLMVWLFRSGDSPPAEPGQAAQTPATPTTAAPPPTNLHADIRQCVKEGRVRRTRLLGGAFVRGDFEQLPTDGGILVGFDVGLGRFVSNSTIGYLQPIYLKDGVEELGPEIGKRPAAVNTVKARPGYAVGGLRIGAGGVMDGMAITFMKQKGKFLDPSDSYESDWQGGRGGGSGSRLGGDGSVIIGLYGKTLGDGGPCQIGLIYPEIPTDWIVVFRSDDPSIWNDDINRGPNHFAKALDLLPDTVSHLRLTNTATNEYVILEVTKQRLTNVTDEGGRYGWEGRNQFHYGVYHLGIFFRIWTVGDGDVVITRHGPARGWGFGDLAKPDNEGKQGYSWNGKPIAKTVFEIAVKAGGVTDAEAKKILKAGNVRE